MAHGIESTDLFYLKFVKISSLSIIVSLESIFKIPTNSRIKKSGRSTSLTIFLPTTQDWAGAVVITSKVYLIVRFDVSSK